MVGAELLGDHFAVGLGRSKIAERREIKTLGRRIIRPLGHQQRAAGAHIIDDIVEIDFRQDALARIAVENDQIEIA